MVTRRRSFRLTFLQVPFGDDGSISSTKESQSTFYTTIIRVLNPYEVVYGTIFGAFDQGLLQPSTIQRIPYLDTTLPLSVMYLYIVIDDSLTLHLRVL